MFSRANDIIRPQSNSVKAVFGRRGRRTQNVEECRSRNFGFKDEYAYAEGIVLISKVFIYKIKKKISQDVLEKYCSERFGAVKNCRVFPPQKNRPSTGFVLFRDAKSAAKMLRSKTHNLGEGKFDVKAAYSWDQPKSLGAHPMQSSSENVSKEICEHKANSSQMNILDLNDDCLLIIFDYLKLRDQLQFARASKSLLSIFKSKFRLQHKFLDFDKFRNITLWEFRDILRFAGDSIEGFSINLEDTPNRFILLRFVNRFCSRIQKIEIRCEKMKLSHIKSFITFFGSNIRELDFEYTTLYVNWYSRSAKFNLDDNWMEQLQHFNNLEILTLKNFSKLTGMHLDKLKNLKELNLFGCNNFKPELLNNALKSMKSLRAISISRCDLLDKKIPEIMNCCPKLESLKISYNGIGHEGRVELSCLRELQVYCQNESNLTLFLQALAQKPSHNLKKLTCAGEIRFSEQHIESTSKIESLTELSFIGNNRMNYENLEELKKLENLETLRIFSWSETLSVSYIEKLVMTLENFKALRMLYLNWAFVEEIDLDNVYDLLKSLKENGKQSFKLILYEVHPEGIHKKYEDHILFAPFDSQFSWIFRSNI